MNLIVADKHYLVVGLGLTGQSCVRYLVAQGKHVSAIDSRETPPGLDKLKAECSQVSFYCGSFDANVLASANVLVMSPGVALATPEIQAAIANGAQITSDVELFLNQFEGKVVAITGSNGKSTVTQWLGEALIAGGHKVLIAGNIGTPVLSSVGEAFDVAVLELSSFQLELIKKLSADVATILNISEDHLDRYDSMAHYLQAKQRIFFGAKRAVFNRDDLLTQPLVPDSVPVTSIGLNEPDLKQYGVYGRGGAAEIRQGFLTIMAANEVSLPGRHNVLNALSVLALADAVGNNREATLSVLSSFQGLQHRCQVVGEHLGVRYVNDSKATNVGSALAAIEGLATDTPSIFWLVGGQGKGQNFSPLSKAAEHCKGVYVYGEDRAALALAMPEAKVFETLEQAFLAAKQAAAPADTVLLSPACASFDEFKNFEQRGQAFVQWVEALS